jgi:nitrate reductase delta subunit
MPRTFKALAALLSYPSEDLVAAAPAIRETVAQEKLVAELQIEALSPLTDELVSRDLYDLQERYVHLFDRTRSLSLHLFEHVHGESRDRGQAMVDLAEVYRNAGLAISARELPDYLPLFLEFLSTRPVPEALELVGQPAHIFAALAERLRRRSSSYAAVFSILADLANADPASVEALALAAEPESDPDDLEALDRAWQDEEVRFGPSAEAQCGGDKLVPRLRAARRPAPGAEPPRHDRPRTIITHPGTRNA